MTGKFSKETLSSAVDGQISPADLDALLAQAGDSGLRQAWTEMHQVGEMLKSDDSNAALSSQFNQKLFARLDLEAAHSGPILSRTESPAAHDGSLKLARPRLLRRLALPGAAAAAVAAVAMTFGGGQALMVADGKAPAVTPHAASAPVEVAAASASPQMIRDPKFDAYLRAHGQPTAADMGAADNTRSTDFSLPKEDVPHR